MSTRYCRIASGKVVGGCTRTAEAEWSGLLSLLKLFQLGLVEVSTGWDATLCMYTRGRRRAGEGSGCVKMSMVIEGAAWWFGGKDRMRERSFSLSQAMYVKQSQEVEG